MTLTETIRTIGNARLLARNHWSSEVAVVVAGITDAVDKLTHRSHKMWAARSRATPNSETKTSHFAPLFDGTVNRPLASPWGTGGTCPSPVVRQLNFYGRHPQQMRTLYFHPVFFFFFSLFSRLISAVADWMSTILPHMMTVALFSLRGCKCVLIKSAISYQFNANLECMSESEMCCTRLNENTGRKKSSKIRQLRAISPQLRRVSTIGKTC